MTVSGWWAVGVTCPRDGTPLELVPEHDGQVDGQLSSSTGRCPSCDRGYEVHVHLVAHTT